MRCLHTGENQRYFLAAQTEGRRLRYQLERAVRQIAGVRGLEVFRYALAVRHVVDLESMTDDHIEHLPGLRRLILLGDDASLEVALRASVTGAVGGNHFFERFGLRRGIEQQQTAYFGL